MGLLKRAVLLPALALTACYSPDLRDCSLACSASSDCIDGQVCGPDQLCAAPGISCRELPGDAGGSDRDAGATDANMPPDAPPDGPAQAALTISIGGKGRVIVQGIGMCDGQAPDDGYCVFPIPLGATITLLPVADPGWKFDRWTTSTCGTAVGSCTVAITAATMAAARFKKDNDD